ncbi:cytidine deoxycytidylate deaminase family protein [Xylariaceae sp. FL0594]|nr:cytidine deoxycytidylate deaminase family protein [Xylariaceae sp. FL0594]
MSTPVAAASPDRQRSYDADPAALLGALLSTIEEKIILLTSAGVASGSKLFGAAILSKEGLVPLTVATNNEAVSPLLHGEINCLQQFFAQTEFPHPSGQEGEEKKRGRPNPRDCVFLATHEPCSLCLSGITWSGFDNFFYLFTYEDSRDLFEIPYDIDILQEVFRVPAVIPTPAPESSGEGEGGSGKAAVEAEDIHARPLYNRKNKFFTARSLADLIDEIAAISAVNKNNKNENNGGEEAEAEAEAEVKNWRDEVQRVKDLYNGLSDTYQQGKKGGVETASFWK